MKNRFKLGVVILLLLSVIAIFISPAVDLQPTALRAVQLANLLFAVLALAGSAVSTRLDVSIGRLATVSGRDYSPLPAPDLVVLNCARIC
ncbi:MAG TPA: hypothetical protein VMU61_02245 [Candidatus Aquilonibacter sp.]|nr:hypothetical protein [Candidatus Aquilonibacter sp.]